MLVVLAVLMLVVAAARNHAPTDLGVLAGLLLAALVIGRWLARDFIAHPANFPS